MGGPARDEAATDLSRGRELTPCEGSSSRDGVARAVDRFAGGFALVGGAMLVEGTPVEVSRDPRVKAVYLGEGFDA